MAFYNSKIALLIIATVLPIPCWSGVDYDTIHALFEEKLGRANYNPEIRPVKNHINITNVTFAYILNSIGEIDEVSQTITTNGHFAFEWMDELVRWNKTEYNNLLYLQPQPKQMWRPRMIITNSVEDQDPFDDKSEPMIVSYDGLARWGPHRVLSTSCVLNMDKYPFDTQRCFIEICPMNQFSDSIRLVAKSDSADLSYYVDNKGWDLLSTSIKVHTFQVEKGLYMSCVKIHMEFKRRPVYFLVTIILPLVLLPFLNIFVFAIPVESDNKLSFGVTVLMAVTIYLSQISSMMPQSSNSVPAVSIYLFSLLVGSIMSVLVTIGIVALHKKDVKMRKYLSMKARFHHAIQKLTNARNAIQPLNGSTVETNPSGTPSEPTLTIKKDNTKGNGNKKNRYRLLCKYIDHVSFATFCILWIFATMYFFIYVNS